MVVLIGEWGLVLEELDPVVGGCFLFVDVAGLGDWFGIGGEIGVVLVGEGSGVRGGVGGVGVLAVLLLAHSVMIQILRISCL